MLTMWILLLASVRPVLYSGDLPGRLGGPGRAATAEGGRTGGFGEAGIPPAGLATRDSVSELADPNGPVALVDPFIGVRDEESNCVIGPQLPFGSINPSPQTPMGSHDGYSPSQPIRGFGQLHATGTGWGKYGQVFVSPQVGLAVGETDHDSPKRDEIARAYEYAVLLSRYNIRVEVTPSFHSAIYRFTFPASDSSNLLVDLTHNIPVDIATNIGGKVSAGEIAIDTSGPVSVKGRGTYSGGFGEGDYEVFFCAEFNKNPLGCGTWSNGKTEAGRLSSVILKPDDRVGAYLTYSTREGDEVLMKVAVSFKSVGQAARWLRSEIPDWDFEKVRTSAIKAWNRELGKIEFKGGPDSLQRIFTTAMYHSMLMPRNRTGDMKGFPDTMPLWDDQYAVWDTWRTVYPLMALINPAMVEGNVNSFIGRFRVNGKVRDSFIAGKDMEEEQGGNDVDNIIADAHAKGIPGINWEDAYEVVKHDADHERRAGSGDSTAVKADTGAYLRMGWLPAGIMSCSKTLEYAYNDYCVAGMAKSLGRPADYRRYRSRSEQWRQLWNPDEASDGFRGFIAPRNADGSRIMIDPKNSWGSWKSYFYEGSSWSYSYFVPHEFSKLVDLCGGKVKYCTRLGYALSHGLIDYWNEPSSLTIHSFLYAGRPDLAALWVRRLMNTGYSLKGGPGNDDSGAMSSWFVFAAIGFFPNAGQNLYYLHGPSFSEVTIHLQEGKTIRVIGLNASEKNIYVQSLKVNGEKWDRPFITHTELKKGAVLEFVMGDRSSGWGK